MTFNRNYAAVPQTPTAPGYAPIPINQKATNAAVLPFQQLLPNAAETVILNPSVSTPPGPFPLLLSVPSKSLIEGQPFEVLISGDILIGGATPTAIIKLYSGTSLTLGSDLLLAATAAASQPASASPFLFRAALVGSTNSGKIMGSFRSMIGGVWGAEATLSAPITGVSFLNNPVANFLFTVTPNNANASSYISVVEFAVNCP